MNLMPCPFCGEVPKIKETSGSYGYCPPTVGVKCCIVSFSFETEEWAEGKGTYSVRGAALSKVGAKWNKRHDNQGDTTTARSPCSTTKSSRK